eukprot:TRINITY_DN4220_c0_g1_i1.p1 TRINITY_DN4220_c0_g1~~TRINITY_DN4220_c0_g1_i1.p1  ORF type:complete len:396 (-),score=51.02 TRINITY_DN4220_c0_g1_i1:59-1246(-)
MKRPLVIVLLLFCACNAQQLIESVEIVGRSDLSPVGGTVIDMRETPFGVRQPSAQIFLRYKNGEEIIDQDCTIEIWQTQQVTCTAAAGIGKDLYVFIQNGGVQLSSEEGDRVSYTRPFITSITEVAQPGDVITFHGNHFGPLGIRPEILITYENGQTTYDCIPELNSENPNLIMSCQLDNSSISTETSLAVNFLGHVVNSPNFAISEIDGFCCEEESCSVSNQRSCKSTFFTAESECDDSCKPGVQGYCCEAQGETCSFVETANCTGFFSVVEENCDEACALPAVKYCCQTGFDLAVCSSVEVNSTGGAVCDGVLYDTEIGCDIGCEPEVFCCGDDGKCAKTKESDCDAGDFFLDACQKDCTNSTASSTSSTSSSTPATDGSAAAFLGGFMFLFV